MNDNRFEFNPSLEWDDKNGNTIVRFKLWDNQTGQEVFSREVSTLPERMRTFEFYESKEWMTLKPKVEKECHFLLNLLMK